MKVIFLNGPCGVGKTTVSKILHEKMSGSFYLNIDHLRSLISDYRNIKDESRVFSMQLGYRLLELCLKEGKDVIFDKMLYLSSPQSGGELVLDDFISLAKSFPADVYEFILWADKETCLNRSKQRGYKEEGLLTPEKCVRFWDEMNRYRQQRKECVVIDTTTLSPQDISEKLLLSLSPET